MKKEPPAHPHPKARRTAFTRLTYLVLLLIVLLLLVMAGITFSIKQERYSADSSQIFPLHEGYAERLSKAVSFRTVSNYDTSFCDSLPFDELHRFLRMQFPRVFETCQVQKYHRHALCLQLNGSQSDFSNEPLVFLAHQDVVDAGDSGWVHPPFSGFSDGESIWGRGTLDDKGSLLAMLEALETLLQNGWQPERTLILALGDDEETYGKGAHAMAAALQHTKTSPIAVFDEGLVITHGLVPMVKKPVALIGIAEKGYLSLKITAQQAGGHSSTPAKQSSILLLNEAITHLYRLGQSSTLTTPVKAFLAALAPEIPWPTRIVFANLWITSPLIKRIYKQSAGGNALVSNTIAFTQLKAGYTDNVIPPAAEATVNIRLLPGTSIEDMINRIHDALNMPGIQIEILQPAHNASEVANSGSWVYQKIHECILAEFPGTVIVPGLVTATSDSRAYTGLTTDIFRFAPYQLDANALESIHGFNERISIKNYTLMIRYYQRLFMSLAGARE